MKGRLQRSDTRRTELELALHDSKQQLEREQQLREEAKQSEMELRGQLQQLELELGRQAHQLQLAREHAQRVANAFAVLKRDQEETTSRLAASVEKVALLEADRNVTVHERKRMEARLRGVKGEVAAVRKQLERERASHRRKEAELEASLEELLGSRSWAVTAPLRAIVRWLGRRN